MVSLAIEFDDFSKSVQLCATGTTSGRLVSEVALEVERRLSGPLEGDLQFGARLGTEKKASVLISGRCDCGYQIEMAHSGATTEIAFHPFFCDICSSVKGVLDFCKKAPHCPTCLTAKVASYGEEPLGNVAQSADPLSKNNRNSGTAHFCPNCINTSLRFEITLGCVRGI